MSLDLGVAIKAAMVVAGLFLVGQMLRYAGTPTWLAFMAGAFCGTFATYYLWPEEDA